MLQLQEALQKLKPLTLQQQQLEKNCASLRKLLADSTACEHNLAGLERELKEFETTYNAASQQIKEAQQRTTELEQQRQALEEQGLLLRQRKDRDELKQRLKRLNRQEEERQRLTEQQQQLNTAVQQDRRRYRPRPAATEQNTRGASGRSHPHRKHGFHSSGGICRSDHFS